MWRESAQWLQHFSDKWHMCVQHQRKLALHNSSLRQGKGLHLLTSLLNWQYTLRELGIQMQTLSILSTTLVSCKDFILGRNTLTGRAEVQPQNTLSILALVWAVGLSCRLASQTRHLAHFNTAERLRPPYCSMVPVVPCLLAFPSQNH